ncbi:MAG: WYL domain-containing protein [Lachnospiraceae bacterium]|nr:WYL domain-containing protein [Lachnospiraceae bacterium]
MAKGTSQKLKLVYLMQIFLEYTDERHSLTMPEILSRLKAYDIEAERKSVYEDIELLRTYGLDIIGERSGRNYSYYLGSRQFELAELKILVDLVQSAKFLTAKKSSQLIRKLETLCSHYEAGQLQHQVYVSERIKTENESIYYAVDIIHQAIDNGVRITFQYFNWNIRKEKELRRGGSLYQVSPWALSWDDENYYLVAYDGKIKELRYYRVDKMLNVELTDFPREGRELYEKMDPAAYTRKRFAMFNGREETVTLTCRNHLAGVIVDQFGRDVPIMPVDQEHFNARVHVALSGQFFGWVMALGEDIQITGPPGVVAQMREEAEKLFMRYTERGEAPADA